MILNRDIIESLKLNQWDTGNEVLYSLCSNHFTHSRDNEIVAKIWLIGRAYAAAIERRKTKGEEINDDFYIKTAAPKFRHSHLDKYLFELRQYKELSENCIMHVLETHKYLVDLIFEFTHLNKRSFCSKYLHFHLPELFFIYDSRVVNAIKYLKEYKTKTILTRSEISTFDTEYANFVINSYSIKKGIEDEFGITISNRHFDNILIYIGNKALAENTRKKNQ